MGIELSVIWFVIIVFATLMYIVMDGFDLASACCSARCGAAGIAT
ncbi:Cytochrome bd2, subunit II [Klebsiella pneumoniae]|uniref:Cytochrome bd2, subunit II n=1 Tax=Klebsiella pneumoniae TaxID=573 RepID=A0A2X3EE40_KLEPN|nr:Cytochrome bd2, subunit II [Klebsiella pneumoniae]